MVLISDTKAGNCIVVGSGIAGLATAIRLAAAGRNVMLFEKNNFLGGKISEQRIKDFRFDTGPSVLTKPDYIKELFDLCSKDISNYIQFEKLDRLFCYYFSDGTSIDSFSDQKKMMEELKHKTKEPPENFLKVLADSRKIYQLTHEVFLERSLHKIKNYLNRSTLRGLLQFHKVRAFQSMHEYNHKHLQDKRLVQLFDRYATYNGSNPFEAPATLNVISHFEINEGSYFPIGGMHKVVEALVKLAEEAGVQFYTGQEVQEIIVRNGKVKGVRTQDNFIESSCVVSNVDIHLVYDKLLPGAKRPEFILKQPRSSSVLVFLWGIRKQFSSLGLHTTFFTKDDRTEYDAIFRDKMICDDPSIYLYNSSSHFPSDAPEGKSNWFVMITAPSLDEQDWVGLVSKARKAILQKLSALLGEDIEKLIEVEEVISPLSIESATGSWKGSVYGNSSNGKFSAFLRHPNFSRKYKGLYFCGGSVHPGAGIPLCLLSARIVSGLIERDIKS